MVRPAGRACANAHVHPRPRPCPRPCPWPRPRPRPRLCVLRIQVAAAKAAPLLASIAKQHEVVLTHGNGPQVGQLALERTASFDVLGAESQGQIGMILASALAGAGLLTAPILSQVLVDSENDPAFNNPTKFVGGMMTKDEAQGNAGACCTRTPPCSLCVA